MPIKDALDLLKLTFIRHVGFKNCSAVLMAIGYMAGFIDYIDR